MLPPRLLDRNPAPPPQILERKVDDDRLWDLQERIVQIETDRRWINTAVLVVLLGAGILAPAIGIWTSEQRAAQYRQEAAQIENRVSELDQDVGELLNAVLAMARERAEDAQLSLRHGHESATQRARGPAAPRGQQGTRPNGQQTASEWAAALGGRILHGPLDQNERDSLRAQWESLDPATQQQTLTALFRRYGVDPDTFLAAIREPDAAG